MPRFWVYIKDQVQGPLDVASLSKTPGFNLLTQVCEEGAQAWRIADEVIEIKSYFLAPPRPNSFAIDIGNTAKRLEPLPPVPETEELVMPEPDTSWQNAGTTEPTLKVISPNAGGAESVPAGGPGASLRAICKVCGFKNPRDVPQCMKCGEEIKAAGAGAVAPVGVASPASAAPSPTAPTLSIPTPIKSDPVAAMPDPVASSAAGAMIDISIPKLIALGSSIALIVGGTFFGFGQWRKHKRAKMASVAKATTSIAPVKTKKTHAKSDSSKHKKHVMPASVAALPGVGVPPPAERRSEPVMEKKTEEVPYHVVAEATPLKNKNSAPLDSAYASKRRGDKALWNSQEQQALRQVQRNRIYGGQRTIERNAEILMQILRDREYTTAFETGKRIYLYNDVDWSAVMMDGPRYEVRLSFSGGRDSDGSPKKPLHFAFTADLERGTVEPGGTGQVRSNTLHAYFDESRIPPEDRRPIAKDTEEVVLAAQPGGSPLALDTVVRQFAKVYTTAALTRVANAYGLANVTKKLTHDTRLGADETLGDIKPGEVAANPKETVSDPVAAKETKPAAAPVFAKGSTVEFRMEKGAGRQKTFIVQATSRATPEKLWEIVTGYDRLKQFVPDMLVSEREGQDGSAVIVHAVYLTRVMFFVFKVNLHLRVIEQMRDRTIQFERIAGEFESFRGSVQITTDPVTRESRIAFHATVIPTGRSMKWSMETMARRLLIPHMEAIRAKAEAL